MSFITISGAGAPADVEFQEAIQKLYPVAYAISMSYKRQDVEIADFQPFVVPPLEGLWTSKEAPENGVLDKSNFIWKIMLRMPDFVTRDTVEWAKSVSTDKKKMNFSEVRFEEITDGKCVQAIHIGSFDTETETFEEMVNFAAHAGYRPVHKNFHHREIYLSDFRKTAAEKLKTVLRLYLEKTD
ncbi:GyrI-like domain-containing protein [Lactococcus allomyrinae]|uniref:GyrI-like domain-containing protein n=1 Tax=Lactococcus allomyrinae TaxID=2419773 RepID=UPI001F093286|nr:GyrI-like domain-containing protein [Lactococcus allomyrinae]